MKLEFCGKIFEKYINSKFHALHSVEAESHTEEQTDERTDRQT